MVFVLLLWVGAIALFYHQWGKINGLEPYQPDFVHANLTLHNETTPASENNFPVSKKGLLGQWWWYSGQCSCLPLPRSVFDSRRWPLNFSGLGI